MRTLLAALLVVALGAPLKSQAYSVQNPAPGFNPNFLLSDSTFLSAQSMTLQEVQQLLERKGKWISREGAASWLSTYDIQPSQNVAYQFRMSDGRCSRDVIGWQYVSVPQRNGVTNEELHNKSVPQLIYDEAQSHGVNPGVILALIQRESSAVTEASIPNQVREGWILGYGYNERMDACDYSEAEARQQALTFGGVGQQIAYATAWLERCFEGTASAPTPFACRGLASWYKDPFVTFDGANITAENRATRVFYVYTPRVYNGNYTLWQLMNRWFGAGNYQPDAVVTHEGATYLIAGWRRWFITPEVAQAWRISLTASTQATPQQLALPYAGIWPAAFDLPWGWYVVDGGWKRRAPSGTTIGVATNDTNSSPFWAFQLIPHGGPTYGFARPIGSNATVLSIWSTQHPVFDPVIPTAWGGPIEEVNPGFFDSLTPGLQLGRLIQLEGTNQMFVVANGRRYAVGSLDTLGHWGMSSGQVRNVPWFAFVYTPYGGTLTRLIRQEGSTSVHLVQNGRKRLVTNMNRVSAQIRAAGVTIVDPATFASLPNGTSL